MFRIPEITYPLTIDTIGKMLGMGHELSVYCHTDLCHHSGRVNLVALGYRLGFDHSCLEADLKPFFFCPKCREAGRPDRNISFRGRPPDRHSDLPRKTNEYAKAKGG